jgi:hypothetical protein
MKPRIYFGHTVDIYNTPKEQELVERIQRELPQYEIENPNQPHHGEGYKRYTAQTGRGMNYFFQEVLPSMEAGVFQPFADGKFGAGVFGEAKFLAERGKPLWEITLEGKVSSLELDPARALSVEETRARVYKK